MHESTVEKSVVQLLLLWHSIKYIVMQLEYFTFQYFLNEKKHKDLLVFIFLNFILEELFDTIFYTVYYKNKMQKLRKMTTSGENINSVFSTFV